MMINSLVLQTDKTRKTKLTSDNLVNQSLSSHPSAQVTVSIQKTLTVTVWFWMPAEQRWRIRGKQLTYPTQYQRIVHFLLADRKEAFPSSPSNPDVKANELQNKYL